MFENYETMNFAKIKVIGVGGGGCNAVNNMIDAKVKSAEFYTVNTDKQALLLSKVPDQNKIQIGERLTKGLGAGSNPEIGEQAAEETQDLLRAILEGTDLLFIAAGMGGGTGTGAAPVIARIARELGVLTVAVVTKPFSFEGRIRSENAQKGILNLKKHVDTIVVIPNDKLLQLLPPQTALSEAFKVADDTLKQGISGIVDLITTPSLINLDFADVNTIMKNQGLAHMGIGEAKGDNRILEAVRQAVSSPLLETTIEGAKGVIINVTGGNDLTLGEANEAARLVQGVVDYSANIIFGTTVDEKMSNGVKITLIATGFSPVPDGDYANSIQQIQFVKAEEKVVEEEKIEEPIATEEPELPEEPVVEEPVVETKAETKELPMFMRKLFGKKNK
ncbi:MAG: cell division protein FtsZ [Clostridia bacterium]|nr:cell division protein FtsZ [Clostridia bacterium]